MRVKADRISDGPGSWSWISQRLFGSRGPYKSPKCYPLSALIDPMVRGK